MKLRIISNGTADGAKILDEKGNTIENCVELCWSIQQGSLVDCTMTFLNMPVELEGEAYSYVDKHFKFTSRFERFKRFLKKLW